MLIIAVPSTMRGMSALAVASAMKDPRPWASSRVDPQLATSATMEAFQAPPDAVMAPVT